MSPGATPQQLAAEANSAAHHVKDELRDHRAAQALVNIDVRDQLRIITNDVGELRVDVATMRGEIAGAGRASRWWSTGIGLLTSVAAFVAAYLLRGH